MWPGALFIDAVPFARRDSLIGFWFYNVISGVRHLLVAVRKSELCSCGCRGYDTLFPIMLWLHWVFAALAKGEVPPNRHDLSSAMEFAGLALGFKVACIF